MFRKILVALGKPAFSPMAESVIIPPPAVTGTIGSFFSKKYRESPHRLLWRRKGGLDSSSWNQCRKSHEALATNFSNIQIGDRVLLISDSDVHTFNITLAVQKRGAQICPVPLKGLTTKVLESYISTLRPSVIFIAKDKVRVHDPLSKQDDPKKMDLDLYSMIWKIFPIDTIEDTLPLKSSKYSYVKSVVLCDQVEALNHHDMITNIKYFETPRDQDYYESPLVHIAYVLRPEFPALSVVADGKWTTHTHQSLLSGGKNFANFCFGNSERVLLLPGLESTPAGYLTMFAVIHAGGVMCYAEDQQVSKGDCKRITRAVFQHEATSIVGTKDQWKHLIGFGDAEVKRDDPSKNWFKSLKWAAVFMKDIEEEEGIVESIKKAFGIQKVNVIRGSPETLNLTTCNGFLPNDFKVSIKSDEEHIRIQDQSKEGRVWLYGPNVTPNYWNNIGLMTVPRDVDGYIKMPYLGRMEKDKLVITKYSPLLEVVV